MRWGPQMHPTSPVAEWENLFSYFSHTLLVLASPTRVFKRFLSFRDIQPWLLRVRWILSCIHEINPVRSDLSDVPTCAMGRTLTRDSNSTGLPLQDR
ncbi:hypothetical protein TNCV_3345501 [Trichonephila clavipes]|nr:hypothetical protein TNCV_3345501 [Trichonephila clavipes]